MSINHAAPDYELDDLRILSTAPELKAMAHGLRDTVLDLLLERAATVGELASAIGRPKGTVAHHVNVLVEAGLVKVVRTRRVRAIDERFYGRTARVFYVAPVLPAGHRARPGLREPPGDGGCRIGRGPPTGIGFGRSCGTPASRASTPPSSGSASSSSCGSSRRSSARATRCMDSPQVSTPRTTPRSRIATPTVGGKTTFLDVEDPISATSRAQASRTPVRRSKYIDKR